MFSTPVFFIFQIIARKFEKSQLRWIFCTQNVHKSNFETRTLLVTSCHLLNLYLLLVNNWDTIGPSSVVLFTVHPADNNGLEETAPEQGHSARSVVIEQLEDVDPTLRRKHVDLGYSHQHRTNNNNIIIIIN